MLLKLLRVGALLYNRGLADAHAVLENHIEAFSEVIYALEKDVGERR
jgi:uncharacterized protein (DUF2164 family)